MNEAKRNPYESGHTDADIALMRLEFDARGSAFLSIHDTAALWSANADALEVLQKIAELT